MFRNNYDNDSVTFSPQGRIFQVEYASEAVKQGSVVVGLVSKTHAVLAAIKVRLVVGVRCNGALYRMMQRKHRAQYRKQNKENTLALVAIVKSTGMYSRDVIANIM
jgi:hypothetical protein